MLKPIGASLALALACGVSAAVTLPFAAPQRARGRRSALRVGMLLALGTGLYPSTGRAEQLSPVDQYVECVEQATNESVSRHIGDPEVALRTVPVRVLLALASHGIADACGPQAETLNGEGDRRGYDARRRRTEPLWRKKRQPEHSSAISLPPALLWPEPIEGRRRSEGIVSPTRAADRIGGAHALSSFLSACCSASLAA
jgi:hypothetical protein